jgi:hypothetical protein
VSQIARDLARRLAEAEIGAAALAPIVAAARAEAINTEGLQAQIEFLLEAYALGEIEAIAGAARP